MADPIYMIDQELCCDFEDCLAVCPVEAIVASNQDDNPVTAPTVAICDGPT
jgi:Fe-S-cluster-containing hydrogenase component 2